MGCDTHMEVDCFLLPKLMELNLFGSIGPFPIPMVKERATYEPDARTLRMMLMRFTLCKSARRVKPIPIL